MAWWNASLVDGLRPGGRFACGLPQETGRHQQRSVPPAKRSTSAAFQPAHVHQRSVPIKDHDYPRPLPAHSFRTLPPARLRRGPFGGPPPAGGPLRLPARRAAARTDAGRANSGLGLHQSPEGRGAGAVRDRYRGLLRPAVAGVAGGADPRVPKRRNWWSGYWRKMGRGRRCGV